MALRNLPTTKLPKRPRLVDFALWVTAAEPALGLKNGEFMEAYTANRNQAARTAVEMSPIGVLLMELIDCCPSGHWHGTTKELLKVFYDITTDEHVRQGLPKQPNKLSEELKLLVPGLRRLGIEIIFHPLRKGQKIITIDRGDSDAKGSNNQAKPENHPGEPSPKTPQSQ